MLKVLSIAERVKDNQAYERLAAGVREVKFMGCTWIRNSFHRKNS